MATYNSLDRIISSVRSSNLNFTYQETPFSLYLTIRKTSIKKHQSNGSESSQMGVRHDVVALEEENLVLKSYIRDLEGKLSAFKDTMETLEGKVAASEAEGLKAKNNNSTIAELEAEKRVLAKTIKKKEKEINEVEKTNQACQNNIKKLEDEVEKYKDEKNESERKHRQIEKEIEENKKAGAEIRHQLDVKDNMLDELAEEKKGLEEKIDSLLDLLYGCYQCGRHGDFCECNSIEEDIVEPSLHDLHELRQLSPTPAETTPHVPPPTSSSPPWTPPPTPPCSSCGAQNYGPCPSSVCFACIPTLTLLTTPPCSNPPSTTPPGTPPSCR